MKTCLQLRRGIWKKHVKPRLIDRSGLILDIFNGEDGMRPIRRPQHFLYMRDSAFHIDLIYVQIKNSPSDPRDRASPRPHRIVCSSSKQINDVNLTVPGAPCARALKTALSYLTP